MIAYAARYGHQPLNVLRAMPLAELRTFVEMLSQIIEGENEGGKT